MGNMCLGHPQCVAVRQVSPRQLDNFQDLVPIKRSVRKVEALLAQSSIREMLKCHDRQTMLQTSAERLRENTPNSATECFPRWPHTFFLPRPPEDLVPIKRSVRKVEALLTQSSITEMLKCHDRKPMIQTSQERLQGNTRHSATECFP